MSFDFDTTGDLSFMSSLAASFGSEIENGVLRLPETLGKGYLKGFDLGPHFSLIINQCELEQDVTLKRIGTNESTGTITFSFRNVFNPLDERKDHDVRSAPRPKHLPSLQISSDAIDLELFFPAKTNINTILITMPVSLLRSLMNHREGHPLLQTILLDDHPYVYEELVSSEIQQIAAQIVTANVPAELHDFYIRIKAQELICLFFIELIKRGQTAAYPLQVADVKTIYSIRDKLISDLSLAPSLPELARFSGMSESKLKRLFKQIFGLSVYTYYQTFRINEAAYLIKEQKLSVSEAGLRLGFTNLSHFSRIFEKQMGHKPKKYSTIR